ncbi:tyrosine--tRNA ligase 1, cytoplasmic isoform X2 [Aegilops tauschii subsp. strangulata]|uniref:tyrosine--tRNA ligase 1, cytoplasmic isoform X2 n=2 Tax=Aegilops tauschii subsp. strangulata TaxID=200361 RepID=UPI00098AF42E|nr:tyrosine--tRNA ligase 1, cytoplasmic isoform X2 [Aegilops tauschii subsp. strangulata]
MVGAGFKVKILIADWFAQMSYKIGSNLDKIQTIGQYNIEVWKATGMDLTRVELVWLSDVMNIHAANFWPLFMDVSQKYTVDNIKRCCSKTIPYGPGILQVTEILLPCLQCAAMLFQKVDIWLLDMDQREVSILARKYCEDIKRENGPIILLNHMLPDLLEYPEIAEKLDHARAISMEDTEDDVNLKVMVRAFCPPQAVKHNPCLEYIKYLILPWFGEFEVVQERNGLHGIFTNMEMLIADYKHGALRAPDMKLALEKAINKILQSVHEHFRNNAYAKIYGKPTSVLLYPKTSCSIAWCLSICRSVRIFHSEQERMFLIMFIHNTIYGSA